MQRKNIALTMLVLFVLVFTSCSSSKSIKPDTPDNTSLLLSMAIRDNNYDSFNKLFSDGTKNTVSKETLSEFSKAAALGFDNSLYEVITYSNGEMFLVKLSAKKINGEYKVENMVKVPDEMKELFQTK